MRTLLSLLVLVLGACSQATMTADELATRACRSYHDARDTLPDDRDAGVKLLREAADTAQQAAALDPNFAGLAREMAARSEAFDEIVALLSDPAAQAPASTPDLRKNMGIVQSADTAIPGWCTPILQ